MGVEVVFDQSKSHVIEMPNRLTVRGGEVFEQEVVLPFSPSQVDDLEVWLDADDADTFTFVDNEVDVWADKSENGVDFSAFSSSRRPVRTEEALNGRAAVEFDGAESLISGAFTSAFSQPWTILIVCEWEQSTGTFQLMFDGPDSADRVIFYKSNSGNAITVNAGTAVNIGESAPIQGLFSILGNGASTSIKLDGVEVSTGNIGTRALKGLTLGSRFTSGAEFLVGKMYELLVFSRTLTSEEEDELTDYLMERWGL